jgi:hypothetical protein
MRIFQCDRITAGKEVARSCQAYPKNAPEIFPAGFGNMERCFAVAALRVRPDDPHVGQSTLNIKRTLPFLATAPGRRSSVETVSIAEGTYRVLATLEYGARTYRVLADLILTDQDARLRLYRFELPGQDEWFAERKLNLSLSNPEVVPLAENIGDAEFILQEPVHLDDTDAAAVFGETGPPAK